MDTLVLFNIYTLCGKIYTRTKNSTGGLAPYKPLTKFISFFKTGKALDLGCGEGRNAIYLAANDFEVDAIDKEPSAIAKLQGYINEHDITGINPITADIMNFDFKTSQYTLAIALHSLDFLKLSDLQILIPKIKNAIQNGGAIFFSVFSTEEPAYKEITQELHLEEIEKNTFFSSKMQEFRHFFTIDELKEFFTDWDIEFIQQREKEDFHGTPHFHNIIEILAKAKDG